jgi:acyl-coenzyme A thioesterase PaaI-like protein
VVLGRPGYVHGGALAGLLEFAAYGALYEALGLGDLGSEAGTGGVTIKPVNVTVQYMRGAAQHDTIAAATITRLGKRVANVEAHAWQLDRAKPVAAAQMNVLLRRS